MFNNLKLKKYKCTLQHDAFDCAAAVLSTICLTNKKELSIMRIRDTIGTDAYGTTVYGVVTGAENLGFSAKAVRVDEESIFSKYTLPAIANITTKEGLSHFVVIHKIRENDLILADPAKGKRYENKKDFLNSFTGVLILLATTSEFEQIKHDKTTIFKMFKSLILPHKKLLATILLASIFLSMIGILSSLFQKCYLMK